MGFLSSALSNIRAEIKNHHQQNHTGKPIIDRGPNGTTIYTGGRNDAISVKENPDGSATVTINGEKYEFSEAEARSLTIDSGSGDDVITVTGDLNIAIRGQAGNDFIRGGDGNEDIDGGTGDDDIDAGGGDDKVNGGDGYDVMKGGDGNDTMDGGNGFDTMDGGDGNDTMMGGTGNDVMRGGDGDDNMNGGWGDDLMEGEAGNDVMNGGWGSDDVYGGDGNDQLWGGPQLRKRRGIFGFIKRPIPQQDNLVGGAGFDTINGKPEKFVPPWWSGGIARSGGADE